MDSVTLNNAWKALAPWVKTGEFTLRSGQKSDLYIDVKGALLSSGFDIRLALIQLVRNYEFAL